MSHSYQSFTNEIPAAESLTTECYPGDQLSPTSCCFPKVSKRHVTTSPAILTNLFQPGSCASMERQHFSQFNPSSPNKRFKKLYI